MLRSRNLGRFCAIVTALSFLLTGAFVYASQSGLIEKASAEGYSKRLFDTSRVHSIDIVMDDWETFIENCTDEEYVSCTVLVDGEKYSNVAIRAKGNTSLSSVQQYGNDRYSLKLEFDHYDSSQTYYGLDKLCLNNLIQDKTMMKDYLAYTLMSRMGVASPECSYVWITVNGSDWGLYLAVEGVEDAFLSRSYGSDSGNLYKPDSQQNGGGRGNGRNFDFADFDFDSVDKTDEFVNPDSSNAPDFSNFPAMPGSDDSSGRPAMPGNADSSDRPEMPGGDFSPGGGMGSSDVKLQYIDDDPESYSNIFSSAKTKIDSDDQERLIESLKALSEGDASVVNADSVMRYLAVHDFLVNGDSYTGSMVHNYYLYEKDGVLEMIPWDYNLAFGAFSFSSGSATGAVNSPIDSPVSGDVSDRPMVAWIFQNETYLQSYHAIYAEFVENNLSNGWLSAEIERVYQMIRPYVEKDPTAFYTADELDQAVQTLQAFCEKRAESILGQLAGTIPSTEDGQTADPSALIDASDLNLNDMGEFNQGGGRGGQTPPNGMTPPDGFSPSDGFTPPDGMTPPSSDSDATTSSTGSANAQSGMTPPDSDSDTSASSDGSADAQNGMPALPEGMTPPGSAGSEGALQSDSEAATGGETTGDPSAAPQNAESAARTDSESENGDETDSESQLEEARRSERAGNSAQLDQTTPNGESPTDSAQLDPSAPNSEPPTDSALPDPSVLNSESSTNSAQPSQSTRDNEAAFSFSRPDQGSPNGESTSDSQTWLLLAVSVFALLAGLIFAKKYRVNR